MRRLTPKRGHKCNLVFVCYSGCQALADPTPTCDAVGTLSQLVARHPKRAGLTVRRSLFAVRPAGLEAVRRQWTIINRGAQPVEARMLAGVGQAWRGGSATGSYTAPDGPNATGPIVNFRCTTGALPR